jgi:CBS domain-containing protein
MRQAETTAATLSGRTQPSQGLLARDVMRVGLPVVAPRDSLAKAARLMEAAGTRELAVTNHGLLVGILTRTDMNPHLGQFEWTIAELAMTPYPVTVAPHTPIGTVMSLLLERSFISVPVASNGELLGMIARTDVIRALADK